MYIRNIISQVQRGTLCLKYGIFKTIIYASNYNAVRLLTNHLSILEIITREKAALCVLPAPPQSRGITKRVFHLMITLVFDPIPSLSLSLQLYNPLRILFRFSCIA